MLDPVSIAFIVIASVISLISLGIIIARYFSNKSSDVSVYSSNPKYGSYTYDQSVYPAVTYQPYPYNNEISGDVLEAGYASTPTNLVNPSKEPVGRGTLAEDFTNILRKE